MNSETNISSITAETDEKILSNYFEQLYAQSFSALAGYAPKDPKKLNNILGILLSKVRTSNLQNQEYKPSVQALRDLLNEPENLGLKLKVESMITEGLIIHQKYEPNVDYRISSTDDMLDALNYIIQHAPEYLPEVSHSAFPMSGLFVYMMYSISGTVVFRDSLFNNSLRAILQEWCAYLDSPESLYVVVNYPDNPKKMIGSWLSPESYIHNNLEEFVTEEAKIKDPLHWGFTSFNDFFHRQIIPICRPVDGVGNKRVIVSANDGNVYRIARNVKLEDTFWLKNQSYSLVNMLNSSKFVNRFVGGDVLQTFLNGNDYHRWRSPISGTVVEAQLVPGYMFSELRSEGFDPSAGTYSQVYQANVNTRGLVFIKSDDPVIGMVCVIPIGITEISSVDIQVRAGQRIEKGDELGWFSYGGSSMCLVFQPGAIEKFTVVSPPEETDAAGNLATNYDNGPYVRANAQIAIAATSAPATSNND